MCIRDRQQLGPRGEAGEVTHGTYNLQTGPHVVDAGSHRCERGHQVQLLQRHQQAGRHEDHQVHRQKQMDAPDAPLVQGLALELDGGHRIGVEHPPHLADRHLLQDHHPGHLDAASGGTGAAADKHPVSYTHLDVYKRQVLPLLNSPLFQNASFLVFLYQIHICFFWIFLPNCVKLNKFLFKF